MPIRRLAACLLGLTVLAAGALRVDAADPDHVNRARDTRHVPECMRCDLSRTDMRNGFFQLANLIGANLSRSNFDGANLAGVQLGGANLSDSSFVYANLSGARLERANLRGANLSNAWLNWAWLAGANLEGTNFAGTKMLGAQLQGADLSKAVGLTSRQLRDACGDTNTKLPPGIERPWCPY